MTYTIRETAHGAGRAFVPHDVLADGCAALRDVDYATARRWVAQRLRPGDIYREEYMGGYRAVVQRTRTFRYSERRTRDFDRKVTR